MISRVCGAVIAGTLIAGCSPKTLQARMREAEDIAGKAEAAVSRGEAALLTLSPDQAQAEFNRAKELLAHPDAPLYPEHDLLKGRLADGQGQLPRVRAELEKKLLAEAVAKAKASISALRSKANERSLAVASTKVTDDAISALRDALDDLRKALSDARQLESRDKDYQAYAKEQLAWADSQTPLLKVATAKLEFIAGPLAESRAAADAMRSAKKTKNLEERRTLYSTARDKFQQCFDTGKALALKTPGLMAGAVSSDGAVASVEGVLADCSKGQKTAEAALKALPTAKAKPVPKPAAKRPTPKKGK